MKETLPIGSIVRLKGSTKRILIIEYLKKKINTENVYDYSGVPFPEGLVDSKKILMIDNNQIEEITVRGILDDESKNIIKKVEEIKEK